MYYLVHYIYARLTPVENLLATDVLNETTGSVAMVYTAEY